MDISIITINYNSSLETLRLIDSIVKYTSEKISFEIIVVDNNSRLEEFKILEEKFPIQDNIKLIRSKINLGFGNGNMLGFHYAKKSEFVVFINNDVIFKEDSLSILITHMQNNPKAGVCGPKMEYTDAINYQLKSFSHFYDLWMNILGIKWYEKFFNKPNIEKKYTSPIKVDFVMGSFLFFRTTDFAEIGGFDTNLFLYYEEMDVCLQLKEIGKETHYVPNSTYIHEAGLSTRKVDQGMNLMKEQQISYHHVFKKHYDFKLYLVLYFLVLIKHSFKCLINPKIHFSLLKLHLQFNPMNKSMKYNQKIDLNR